MGKSTTGQFFPDGLSAPLGVFYRGGRRLGGGLEGGEGEHACDEEEVVENGVHVVVVGVATARTVQTAGYAGLPEMRGVVARVALRETDTKILRVPPRQRLEIVLHHLDDRLGQGHVDAALGEPARAARSSGREL